MSTHEGEHFGGGDFGEAEPVRLVGPVQIAGITSHAWAGRFLEVVTMGGIFFAIDPLDVVAWESDTDGSGFRVLLRNSNTIYVPEVDGRALWRVLMGGREWVRR